MKRNILFGSILAATLSIGVGAQTPAGSGGQAGTAGQAGSAGQGGTTGQGSSRQAGGKMSDDKITVTGCLQPATTGTSASAGDASKADNFILANVMSGAGSGGSMSSPSSSATGTSGSTAAGTASAGSATGSSASGGGMSGSSTSGASTYHLSGGKKDELRTMVNSKVEITGKIDQGPSAGTSNNGASSSAGTTGSAMSTGSRAPETPNSGQTLKIDSIRKIAGSCS